VVQEKLDVEWSPEQISAWLRLEHADRPDWHLYHETIYVMPIVQRDAADRMNALLDAAADGEPVAVKTAVSDHPPTSVGARLPS
jgi:IS30 family transposase